MYKRIFILSSVVLLALVLVSATAAASTWNYASGEYFFSEAYENFTFSPHGANCEVECDATYPFQGDLEGVAKAHFLVLVHGPCDQALPFAFKENYWAQGTFYGKVLDKEGTFDFDYTGKGWPAEVGEQALKSQIRVTSGTGELENLRGKLDISYVMGDPFDQYSGWLSFKD